MNKSYVVKSGDTLLAIARKFNTTVEVLVALNNIKNKNLIRVGQVMSLPTVDTKPSTNVKDYSKIGQAVENLVERVENLPEFKTLMDLMW